MINQYDLSQPGLILESDPAGEFPLYLFLFPDKKTLFYSDSITELLNDSRIPKPLTVSAEGLSFLLQSGVVAPPKTAYENVFILGIGDKVNVSTENGSIALSFSHDFPFLNANRLSSETVQPDEDLILKMLAEATISRIDESKPSYLFHSAGKDSNSIALALAEAGWQDKVTLITHKSKGSDDESVISAKIAKQLGFKHQVLNEVEKLEASHKSAIEDYFINSPFPVTDNVTLAYPLYSVQVPELKGANIIDGMGNDVFIGHIPSQAEFKYQKLSRYLKYSRFLSKNFASESLLHVAGKTRNEWTGLSGLSFSDVKRVFPAAINVSSFWFAKDSNIDYLDFRASSRGTFIDQEIFTRKVRNFADAFSSNLILPWANEDLVSYFVTMPEKYLFDRKALKNKLVLRKMLKERMGLDSDKIGKMGFTFDFIHMIVDNWESVFNEIMSCDYWSKGDLETLINRLHTNVITSHKRAHFSAYLIHRLFVVSFWLNKNKYLQVN